MILVRRERRIKFRMECRGAIFDMDGLLFDTERVYQETWEEIAEEWGVKLGRGFTREISGTTGERSCCIVERYYHVSNGNDIRKECMNRVKEKLNRSVPMKSGVHEILGFFREKGIPTAVASSNGMEQIESNLEKAGIRDYFTEVVSGVEVANGKPAPDIFLLAAERLNCAPGECFVFEDSENGIKAGHAAGCMTVMVPDLMEASPEILPYCTMVCSDLIQAREEIQKFDRDK